MKPRIVETCFGKFVIEQIVSNKYDMAVSVGDKNFFYYIPKGLTDEGIKDHFEELAEFEA